MTFTRPPDWILPDWPAPAGVHAFVTTRQGGVSTGAHAGMNLGRRCGDQPEAVTENRRRLNGLLPTEPLWLHQVHGSSVVDAHTTAAETEADASVARQAHQVCAILVADCLPVLFASDDGLVVAAAHAGWRGLAGGVLENTVTAMAVDPASLHAYIGPSIGPTAFEVGEDVRTAFCRNSAENESAFIKHLAGKWLCDLPGLARSALKRAGVQSIHGGGDCTWSDPGRFYSYRRDGITGRMAALIWRD